MKNQKNVKKLTTAALTAILTAGMSISAFADTGASSVLNVNGDIRSEAFAENGQGGRGFNGGRMMGRGGMGPQNSGMAEGEMPELPEGMEEGEMPELPEGMEEGEMPELPEGMEEGERPELPEGMEEGERPELPEGMEEGERPELPEGMQEGQGRMGRGMGFEMLDIEAINTAIESFSGDESLDTDTLNSLIEAYESALTAEKEAIDSESELSEDEMNELRNAVKEAQDALITALDEAGIEISTVRPERPEGEEFQENRIKNSECQNNKITVTGNVTDEDASSEAENDGELSVKKNTETESGFTGTLKKIGNSIKKALGNLFHR